MSLNLMNYIVSFRSFLVMKISPYKKNDQIEVDSFSYIVEIRVTKHCNEKVQMIHKIHICVYMHIK